MKVRAVSVLWHRMLVVRFGEDIIGVDGAAQHKLCLVNSLSSRRKNKENSKNTAILCIAVFRKLYQCFYFFEAIRPCLETLPSLGDKLFFSDAFGKQ